MKDKIIFEEVQQSWWIRLLFWVIIIALGCSYYFQWGENPISLAVFLGIGTLLLITSFIFSTLRIQLNTTELKASFGIKYLTQKVNVSEIDFSTVKVENAPILYGIGLRLTPKGTLYNTKPGKAIWLKSINGKTFFVGTAKAEELKSLILSLKK